MIRDTYILQQPQKLRDQLSAYRRRDVGFFRYFGRDVLKCYRLREQYDAEEDTDERYPE